MFSSREPSKRPVMNGCCLTLSITPGLIHAHNSSVKQPSPAAAMLMTCVSTVRLRCLAIPQFWVCVQPAPKHFVPDSLLVSPSV